MRLLGSWFHGVCFSRKLNGTEFTLTPPSANRPVLKLREPHPPNFGLPVDLGRTLVAPGGIGKSKEATMIARESLRRMRPSIGPRCHGHHLRGSRKKMRLRRISEL